MANYTIFTDKGIDAFLTGVGPCWEDYIATTGEQLPFTLGLLPENWVPSEGSMIITDFKDDNQADVRTAFHYFFPNITPDFNVTNTNYGVCPAYYTSELGGWDIVLMSSVEIQPSPDGDADVYSEIRILSIPRLPNYRNL